MSDEKAGLKASPSEDISISWHTMSSTDVLEKLETQTESGLSSEEVKSRQESSALTNCRKPLPRLFGRCCGTRSTVLLSICCWVQQLFRHY